MEFPFFEDFPFLYLIQKLLLVYFRFINLIFEEKKQIVCPLILVKFNPYLKLLASKFDDPSSTSTSEKILMARQPPISKSVCLCAIQESSFRCWTSLLCLLDWLAIQKDSSVDHSQPAIAPRPTQYYSSDQIRQHFRCCILGSILVPNSFR